MIVLQWYLMCYKLIGRVCLGDGVICFYNSIGTEPDSHLNTGMVGTFQMTLYLFSGIYIGCVLAVVVVF